mgnify:CR=1 FL=1
MRLFLLVLLVLHAGPALASTARSFMATVTHVTDGDTVWVRPAPGGAPLQVRLQGLDPPEICQASGPQSRQALARRLLHQPVRVHAQGRDDYQRLLGRLQQGGQDVGGWLVANGWAWSQGFRRQAGPYDTLQARARKARRGLWSGPQPVLPRTFRQRNGPCHRPAR